MKYLEALHIQILNDDFTLVRRIVTKEDIENLPVHLKEFSVKAQLIRNAENYINLIR